MSVWFFCVRELWIIGYVNVFSTDSETNKLLLGRLLYKGRNVGNEKIVVSFLDLNPNIAQFDEFNKVEIAIHS